MKAVDTPNAPRAIGPYSQAVRAGQFLFISGTLGIDPTTNKLRETIQDQTLQVIDNIEAILKDQGLTFEQVVKVEIYLKDMNDFKVLNALYAERFTFSIKPARQTMQVAALPLEALIEISCIAYCS